MPDALGQAKPKSGSPPPVRALPLRDRKKLLASCWPGGVSASSSAPTPTKTALQSSSRLAAWGWEGIVSKRLSAPYRSGPSRDWLKIKNPDSPAMVRHREESW
jgi:ATP-dependent DNA ligase